MLGRCKTRLIPKFGAEGACAIHMQLTNRTLEECVAAFGADKVLLAVTDWHDALTQMRNRFGIRMVRQQSGHLGRRMHAALHSALTYRERAVLVGTDCPTLTASKLLRAAEALDRTRMVFTPSEDGGYVLVGASLLAREAFRGIPWSTEEVMVRTRERLVELGWRQGQHWLELPTEWDIDFPADAVRASKLGLLALPPSAVGGNY